MATEGKGKVAHLGDGDDVVRRKLRGDLSQVADSGEDRHIPFQNSVFKVNYTLIHQ